MVGWLLAKFGELGSAFGKGGGSGNRMDGELGKASVRYVLKQWLCPLHAWLNPWNGASVPLFGLIKDTPFSLELLHPNLLFGGISLHPASPALARSHCPLHSQG